MEKNRSSKAQFIIDFFSGGVSGIIAKTICAPVERVKLLMQTASMNSQLTRPYSGIMDCAKRCFYEDGFLSLWRGNGVNVIRYFPTQALNFSFKDMFARYFKSDARRDSKQRILLNNILSGGFAGTLTTCFVYPLDLARTRLGVDLGRTSEERQFKGLTDCLRQVHQTGGIRGLYQGIGICFIGIFIYRGLYFGIYDTGKDVVFKDNLSKYILLKFFFAQAVVIFSETISYPTDTIKRKLMMQSAGGQIKYKNALDCFTTIKREDGLMSLMKGNASNIVRSFGSSLCLILYDEIKLATRQRNSE